MTQSKISFIISFLIIICSFSYAQDKNNLDEELQILKGKIKSLEKEKTIQSNQIKQLDKRLKTLKDSMDFKLNVNAKELKNVDKKLSSKIDITDSSATKKYADLDKSAANNKIYWIIGFIVLAALLTAVYYILKKRINSEKNNLGEQISNTRKELEEEGIKLDNKLIEILNSQLKILEANKVNETTEKDHSLALKVADEIIRIEKNLTNMDPNLKGHKQLEASVNRIKDNFVASGYEIVDMLNKTYDMGMKVTANFRPSEHLKPGEQIITRIIKPQVNYRGAMIQSAQIEVSQGE